MKNLFGSVVFEGKEYILQADAYFTSRVLPAPAVNFHEAAQGQEYDFEMSAPAIGEDGLAYEIVWIFSDTKGQEQDLDGYDYDDIFSVNPTGQTVYTVVMHKGTDDAWDETATPRTLLRTLDYQRAREFAKNLPDRLELGEPEFDLSGLEKYESPRLFAGDDELNF